MNTEKSLSICPHCCHRQLVSKQAVFSRIAVKCESCKNGFTPQPITGGSVALRDLERELNTREREQNRVDSELQSRSQSGNMPESRKDNDTMCPQTLLGIDPTFLTIDLFKLILAETCEEPSKIQYVKESKGNTPSGRPISLLKIRADATNFGSILGKAKKNYLGLVAIYRIIGEKAGHDVRLLLEEIPGGLRKTRPRFESDPNWPKDKIEGLLQKVFDTIFDRESIVVIQDSDPDASSIDVFTSALVSERTAAWVEQNLSGIISTMCARNRKWLTTFRIIRDQMLYEQATLTKRAA